MCGRLIAQRAVAQRDDVCQRHWQRLRSSYLLAIACSTVLCQRPGSLCLEQRFVTLLSIGERILEACANHRVLP